MRFRQWFPAVLVLALLSLGGCAAAGAGAGTEGNTTLIVENNLIPSASLSIYAVPEVGGRRLVGMVNPGETATLRFNPVGAATQYQFVAETTAGADIVSNPITFSPGATIRWDLTANIATVTEPGTDRD